MKIFFIFLSALASAANSSNATAETFSYFDKGSEKKIEILMYEDLHISKNCFKNGSPNCKSFEATKVALPPQKSKTALFGNPASIYCHAKNGVSRVAESKDYKQYDYCLFADGSMIDSWDLFYLHFPRQSTFSSQ